MINDKRKNLVIVTMITIIVIVLGVLGASYAYFQGSIAGNGLSNIKTIANSLDNLVFTPGSDITITANQSNFGSGSGNRSGSTTSTVTLTARNDASSTHYYRVFLIISENTFVYTNGTTPELVLNVKKNNVAVINNMDITTKKGGIDIPTVSGGSSLKQPITASAGSTTTDTWEATVTFVNLNSNQNANAGKGFRAVLYIDNSPILPDDYQEISYILSTGSQYINTNIIPDDSTGMYLDYDMTNVSSDRILVGTRGDSTDTRYWIANSNSIYIGFNTNNFYGTASVANTRHTASLNFMNNRKKMVDEVAYSTISTTLASQSYPIFVYAFNRTGSPSNYSIYKLYRLKISKGDSIIANFVPCYRISDSAGGLCDTVNGGFYPKTGSTDFTKGTNVT